MTYGGMCVRASAAFNMWKEEYNQRSNFKVFHQETTESSFTEDRRRLTEKKLANSVREVLLSTLPNMS